MNVKRLIAATAACAAAGSAFAQQREFAPPEEGFVSTKSRAEVKEELRQAQASGNFVVGGTEYGGQHIVSTWRGGETQRLQLAGKKQSRSR